MPFLDLSDQVAIVTGAATGIGEAIARRLADAGAMVAIADVDLDAAKRTSDKMPGTFAVQIDVTSADSVRKAIGDVAARKNRIDILVNNAGVAGKAAPITEQSEEDWHRII